VRRERRAPVHWRRVGTACGGSPIAAYPYRAAYQPLTCNGEDYDGIPAAPTTTSSSHRAGGRLHHAGPAIYDLAGNAKEWTSQYTGRTPDNTPIVVVRGGAYDRPHRAALRFTLSRAAVDVLLPPRVPLLLTMRPGPVPLPERHRLRQQRRLWHRLLRHRHRLRRGASLRALCRCDQRPDELRRLRRDLHRHPELRERGLPVRATPGGRRQETGIRN